MMPLWLFVLLLPVTGLVGIGIGYGLAAWVRCRREDRAMADALALPPLPPVRR